MKITVNIDCSPDEARAFLGLPDIRGFQTAVLGELQERMTAGLKTMDAESLIRSWLPTGFQGMEQFTKALFAQFEATLGKEMGK